VRACPFPLRHKLPGHGKRRGCLPCAACKITERMSITLDLLRGSGPMRPAECLPGMKRSSPSIIVTRLLDHCMCHAIDDHCPTRERTYSWRSCDADQLQGVFCCRQHGCQLLRDGLQPSRMRKWCMQARHGRRNCTLYCLLACRAPGTRNGADSRVCRASWKMPGTRLRLLFSS